MASSGCGNDVIATDNFDLSEILDIVGDVECRGGAVVVGGACCSDAETGDGDRREEDLNSDIDGEVSCCRNVDEQDVSHDQQETPRIDTIHQKITTAVDLLRRAAECEKNADIIQSLRLYKDVIEILHKASKEIGNKGKLRTLFNTKILDLLTKAEHLKDKIKEKREASVLSTVPQGSDEYDEATQRRRDYLAGFIMDPNENLNRSDIVGQEEAITSLLETIVLPIKFPKLFTRYRMADILFCGHPGTGKTMALRACASEIPEATFFKLSIYDFMSKYEPNVERNVIELFRMASERKNCIISIEDIDRLYRDESDIRLRRIHTELLVQMHGYGNQVMVVCITQTPWHLNRSLRRSLGKRICFQLPTKEDRINILKANLKETNHNLTDEDFEKIGDRTASAGGKLFTQADMVVLSREIMMQMVRRVQCAKYFRKMTHPVTKIEDHWMPCNQDDEGAVQMTWMDVDAKKLLEPDIDMNDVLLSLASCSGTVNPGENRQMSDWIDMYVG